MKPGFKGKSGGGSGSTNGLKSVVNEKIDFGIAA